MHRWLVLTLALVENRKIQLSKGCVPHDGRLGADATNALEGYATVIQTSRRRWKNSDMN